MNQYEEECHACGKTLSALFQSYPAHWCNECRECREKTAKAWADFKREMLVPTRFERKDPYKMASKSLRPWEEHTRQNMLDGQPWGGMITYWRRTTEAGEEVVTLGPEGLGESMCWAWLLPSAIGAPGARDYRSGVTYGSHLEREQAMRQADDALKALGYEP